MRGHPAATLNHLSLWSVRDYGKTLSLIRIELRLDRGAVLRGRLRRKLAQQHSADWRPAKPVAYCVSHACSQCHSHASAHSNANPNSYGHSEPNTQCYPNSDACHSGSGSRFFGDGRESRLSQVIGSAAMPYFNSLATQHALATQYFANAHPSIGNYFMLTTGNIETNDD